MRKKIVTVFLIAIIEVMLMSLNVQATCANGIYNNGLGGIYIDINSAPYTTFATYSYGQYAYTTAGCAWFASARVNQLTGKGSIIYSGTSWYNSAYSYYGFTRGQTPQAGSLICWGNHVAVLEKIEGSTAYISEGGYSSSQYASYGYCKISTTSVDSISSRNSNFLGYVYLGDDGGNAEPPTNFWGNADMTLATEGDTVTLNWGADNATSGYWITMYRNGESYLNQGFGSSTSYSSTYPLGEYVAYIIATNSAGRSEICVTFTVHAGDDFYGYIIHTNSWMHLTNDNTNVSIRALTGAANQIWHFERDDDNSYKITSTADGKVLEVSDSSTESGANIDVGEYIGGNNQKWKIYGESAKYNFKAVCTSCYMDISGGYTNEGNNVQAWEKNGTTSQEYQIWRLDTSVGKPTLNVSVSDNLVTFSWDKVSNATRYDLRIYDCDSNDAFETLYIDGSNTSYQITLDRGKYKADLAGYNGIYGSWTFGDKIDFSVTTITPTPMPTEKICFAVDNQGTYANITNNGMAQTVTVIIAEYADDGSLKNISATDVAFTAGETQKLLLGNGTHKVFVWDSLDGMKPLSK